MKEKCNIVNNKLRYKFSKLSQMKEIQKLEIHLKSSMNK